MDQDASWDRQKQWFLNVIQPMYTTKMWIRGWFFLHKKQKKKERFSFRGALPGTRDVDRGSAPVGERRWGEREEGGNLRTGRGRKKKGKQRIVWEKGGRAERKKEEEEEEEERRTEHFVKQGKMRLTEARPQHFCLYKIMYSAGLRHISQSITSSLCCPSASLAPGSLP